MAGMGTAHGLAGSIAPLGQAQRWRELWSPRRSATRRLAHDAQAQRQRVAQDLLLLLLVEFAGIFNQRQPMGMRRVVGEPLQDLLALFRIDVSIAVVGLPSQLRDRSAR